MYRSGLRNGYKMLIGLHWGMSIPVDGWLDGSAQRSGTGLTSSAEPESASTSIDRPVEE